MAAMAAAAMAARPTRTAKMAPPCAASHSTSRSFCLPLVNNTPVDMSSSDATGGVAIPDALRRLPSVDTVLRQPDVAALAGPLPRDLVAELVRTEVEDRRQRARAGDPN